MPKKMLLFDFKQSEKDFFESKKFADFDISFFEGSLNENTIKNVSLADKENAEIISVFINSHINLEVIESFPNLKLIATRSTGYNHINLEECLEHDVAVTNVLKYGEKTVLEYTFGLIIALVRKIIPAISDMKKLKNCPESYLGNDLSALTLGVVGTGVIGSSVCALSQFFKMKTMAYDIEPKLELAEKYNFEYVEFEKLIKESDIITIHVPYHDENYHMISKREIEKMKPTAYLINTSRGELIDTYSLYKALLNNRIQGCALDVGECEDFSFDMENFLQKIPTTTHNCLARTLVIQKMMDLPNVIITPHIAYNTKEAINDILETTFENINAFYKGKKLNRVI